MSFRKAIIITAAAGLVIAGFSRLKIPRDITREKNMNDDTVSQAYDGYSNSLILSIERRLSMSELRKMRPEGIMLDAGCGPGHLDMEIRKDFPELKIIGLDTAGTMLNIARQNAARAFPFKPEGDFNPDYEGTKIYANNISFCRGDVHYLPVNSESIDFVVSTGSLHHWPDPEKAFREIHRVLKPGGEFLVFDLRRDIPRALYTITRLMQKFSMPEPIRRANGAVGSIWSAFTPG